VSRLSEQLVIATGGFHADVRLPAGRPLR